MSHRITLYNKIEETPSPVGNHITCDGVKGPVITHRMMTPWGGFICNQSRDHKEVTGFIQGDNRLFEFSYNPASLTVEDDIINTLKWIK